jgi:ligand-binding SRPBCC domain-containing protein
METRIEAPPERCFDLALSVSLHLESTRATGERLVEGPERDVLELGDVVTWEARHFGKRRRLTVRIAERDRPRHFRDDQLRGPFRRFRHDHMFEGLDGGRSTLMRDDLDVVLFPGTDRFAIVPHLRKLLLVRNQLLRTKAETLS